MIPKSRLYVHLSGDHKTAVKVGSRHGKAVVYKVLAEQMSKAGIPFYKSVNGVWLTKAVPVEYLVKEDGNTAEDEMISEEIRAAL